MSAETRFRIRESGVLTAAGLAMLWGVIAGAADLTFFQATGYQGLDIHLRYLSFAALMQAVMTIPIGLAAWGLHRIVRRRQPGEHPRHVGLIAVQVTAVVLAIALRFMHWAHTSYLGETSVVSVAGIAVTFGILVPALIVCVVMPPLIARWPGAGVDGIGRLHRFAAVAGGTLALLSFFVALIGSPGTAVELNRPNVLLISIDSVRADVWAEHVDHHASDTLKEFVSASRRFHNAYTTYSSSLASHGSMFSGLYPTEHGALGKRLVKTAETGMVINSDLELLAERFGAEGYETTGIMANSWLGPPWGLEAGFQTYVNKGRPLQVGFFSPMLAVSASIVGPYVHYAGMRISRRLPNRHPDTRLFRSWLTNRDTSRPFFCFLHYLEMHVPNDPPRQFAERFSSGPFGGKSGSQMQRMIEDGQIAQKDMPAALAHIRALNLASLALVDDLLAPALAALNDHNVLEDTLVILTSDHGDNLYEKVDDYSHSHVYDVATRIPLAIRVPGASSGLDDEVLASLVDIPRTVYSYAGVSMPQPLRGIDLLGETSSNPGQGRSIYLQGWDHRHSHFTHAVRTDQFKLILLPGEEFELYDMKKDTKELNNLAAEMPEVVTALAEEFEQARSQMLASTSRMIQVEDLPADVVKQLRSLGYIE